ncbi:hypothetical protein GGS21DRAFT_82738 [Xylaria nigripes]|nr:hypothetical protein GGS21DRAFT_82738 [Xylaria nigripes]
MCIGHCEEEAKSTMPDESLVHNVPGDSREPFPWDVGIFDAHCHPTDSMASTKSIPDMKARVLTVMATRSQDQELVYDIASRYGVQDNTTSLTSYPPTPRSQGRIVPSFGWHPWFSYEFYDDTASNPTYNGHPPDKTAHYDRVLVPPPSSKDILFSEGLCDPRPLSSFLDETQIRLEKFPLALVGEIGVDKAFRLPMAWTLANEANREEGLTPGSREGRRLSPYRVQIAHQVAIFRAQLKLAGKMRRPVSVHGVQAHGIVYDTIAACWKGHEKEVLSRRQKRQIATGAEDFSSDADSDSDYEISLSGKNKPAKLAAKAIGVGPLEFPPRICLHSYSGYVEQLKMYLHPSVPAKVYFSFSIAVNWGSGEGKKTEEVIRATPDDRLLVESDLHIAGELMDGKLEEVCRKICQIKGWSLREGVEILRRNWQEFVLG